ncbi:zinc ribbon domain-containing protein [Prevotella sp.]|uniref:zinc ribbon domain-containing protein n=1 Tax=Prevotella sp. TaxID=59823 RepID=UPI003FD78B58
MAIIQCPECGQQMSGNAKACPHCGYQYKKEKQKLHRKQIYKSKPFISFVLILIGVVIAISITVFQDYQRKAENERLRFERELNESIKDSQYPWRQWRNFDLNSLTDKETAKRMLKYSTLLPDSDKLYEEKLINQHFNCW